MSVYSKTVIKLSKKDPLLLIPALVLLQILNVLQPGVFQRLLGSDPVFRPGSKYLEDEVFGLF